MNDNDLEYLLNEYIEQVSNINYGWDLYDEHSDHDDHGDYYNESY